MSGGQILIDKLSEMEKEAGNKLAKEIKDAETDPKKRRLLLDSVMQHIKAKQYEMDGPTEAQVWVTTL